MRMLLRLKRSPVSRIRGAGDGRSSPRNPFLSLPLILRYVMRGLITSSIDPVYEKLEQAAKLIMHAQDQIVSSR